MGDTPVFPIADIIESYGGTPTYRGGWSPLQCPFHGDRNASATINHRAQRFCCHVCMERSEDAIGIVMWQDGVDYKRAVEICESITEAEGSTARKPKGMSSMF